MQQFFEPFTKPLIAQFREDKFINKILDEATQSVKDELEFLAFNDVGVAIQKRIYNKYTSEDLITNPETIWSFFVQYGLLTCKPLQNNIHEVSIPNKSLQLFLIEKIVYWEGANASSTLILK